VCNTQEFMVVRTNALAHVTPLTEGPLLSEGNGTLGEEEVLQRRSHASPNRARRTPPKNTRIPVFAILD
jgi:hypothetical protein